MKINLTIHLVHGSTMRVEVESDAARLLGVADDLERALQRNSFAVEVDGRLIIIPHANVRFMEISPAPAGLPVWLLRGKLLTE